MWRYHKSGVHYVTLPRKHSRMSCLSQVQITRGFALAGLEATKHLTEEVTKQQAHQLRLSQHVAGPESDKPQGSSYQPLSQRMVR